MTIRTKRVYEPAVPSDGKRILVDRLWPRGVSKDEAHLDFWAKTIAPSNELRKWYQHDHAKWPEFRKRFFAELDANTEALAELETRMKCDTVTFVYGSKEEELNNATALREYVEARR